jgi:hypothetical protein
MTVIRSANSLQAAISVLLSTNSEPSEISAAACAAHTLLSAMAELGECPDETSDKLLPGGVAIAPNAAALCLTDHIRTAMFVRGVRDAIAHLQFQFPGEILDVVYAGCGPFAPLLVMPMLGSVHESSQDGIQFTLIDAHHRSLDAARQIIETLGLDRYVRSYVCADAATYLHPGDRAIHLVITETMQRALEKEPQVAITANLAPQLRKGGALVPEEISVVAYLMDQVKEFTPPGAPERDRIRLGEIMQVSAHTAPALNAPAAVRIKIPKLTSNRYMLALSTVVKVFGPHLIEEYASGITNPVWLRHLPAKDTPAVVEFTYESGEKPGLRYVVL